MKTLILMQGIPGSGKSTMVEAIQRRFGYSDSDVFSTDEYWYQDDPTKYQWDGRKTGIAHKWNQDRATAAMARGVSTVIIDNTNIKARDVVPYTSTAKAYGYDIQVVRVSVDPQLAIERQAHRPEDRRVPEEVIRRMHNEMENLV